MANKSKFKLSRSGCREDKLSLGSANNANGEIVFLRSKKLLLEPEQKSEVQTGHQYLK